MLRTGYESLSEDHNYTDQITDNKHQWNHIIDCIPYLTPIFFRRAADDSRRPGIGNSPVFYMVVCCFLALFNAFRHAAEEAIQRCRAQNVPMCRRELIFIFHQAVAEQSEYQTHYGARHGQFVESICILIITNK